MFDPTTHRKDDYILHDDGSRLVNNENDTLNLPADCNLPNGGYPVTESHPEQRCLFWCQDVVWQWEGVDAGNGNSPAEGKLGKFN